MLTIKIFFMHIVIMWIIWTHILLQRGRLTSFNLAIREISQKGEILCCFSNINNSKGDCLDRGDSLLFFYINISYFSQYVIYLSYKCLPFYTIYIWILIKMERKWIILSSLFIRWTNLEFLEVDLLELISNILTKIEPEIYLPC